MNKRLLSIQYKINDGTAEGGVVLSQTNLNAIKDILGAEHVDIYGVHDYAKKKTIWDKIVGIYGFCNNRHYGLTRKKLNEIINLSEKYDFIFIDRSVFGIIAKKLKERNYRGKIITFFHNFEPDYFRAILPKFYPGRSVYIRSVINNELWACQYSDVVIALNERDNYLIAKNYGRSADILMPISLNDNYTPTEAQKQAEFVNPPTALFFGTNFPPNKEGILWFVKEVFPHVNIKLQIVGKNMDKLGDGIPAHPNIELHGTVPDLQKYIVNADFAVLPVFKGSGMKVKTCEAMMYGKHIIGSTETFEGYDVDYNKIGALANTKEEFISAIGELISDNPLKYNEYARTLFLENYSSASAKEKLKSILTD
ncbi:MAG: glycosyltransferase family 4 protein [Bacteroidales bacterium]|nr:glycosyltransferase family 4 protein [Bacteroidales bacterium]